MSNNNDLKPLQNSLPSQPIIQTITRDLNAWVILTIRPLLTIAHLTIVYVVALYADSLVLQTIRTTFQSSLPIYPLVARILEGIEIFSALGVAIAYGLHMVISLYYQAKHVLETMKSTEEQKDTQNDSKKGVS